MTQFDRRTVRDCHTRSFACWPPSACPPPPARMTRSYSMSSPSQLWLPRRPIFVWCCVQSEYDRKRAPMGHLGKPPLPGSEGPDGHDPPPYGPLVWPPSGPLTCRSGARLITPWHLWGGSISTSPSLPPRSPALASTPTILTLTGCRRCCPRHSVDRCPVHPCGRCLNGCMVRSQPPPADAAAPRARPCAEVAARPHGPAPRCLALPPWLPRPLPPPPALRSGRW